MLTILFILLLVFTVLTSKLIYYSYFNPMSIFFGVFFLALSMFYAADFVNHDMSAKSIILLFSSLICFFYGVLIGKFKYTKVKLGYNAKKTIKNHKKLEIREKDIKIFSVIFILSLLGFLYFLYVIEMRLGLLNVLKNPNILNLAYHHNSINFNIIPIYMMKLSMVNAMFLLVYILKFKIKNYKVISMFILEVIMNVSVNRSNLIYVIVLCLFIYVYYNSKSSNVYQMTFNIKNLKKYVMYTLIVASFGFFFIAMQSLLNKQANFEGTLMGIPLNNYMVSIVYYFIANFASFNEFLEMRFEEVTFLGATLRNFYSMFDGFLDYSDSFLEMPFVYVPNKFNTTIAQFYIYLESGIVGIIIMYTFLGYLSTSLYFKYQKYRDDVTLLYLAFISTIILFSVRGYLLIFLDFWRILIFIILLNIYIKYNKKKRV